MNLWCALPAGIGALCVLLGRRLIIEDAKSFSNGWVWAIRLLPLADLMYLARYWDSAKSGAFLSIAGLVLMLPAGGKALWDKKHPPAKQQAKGTMLGSLDGDTKSALFQSMKFEHEARISRKEEKLQTLNARLAAWYQSIESRRPALTNAEASGVAAFHHEAAAYSSFHGVAKSETAELMKLQEKRYDNWGAISDEDYREYLQRNAPSNDKREGHDANDDDP